MEIVGIKALSLVRIRFKIGSIGASNEDGLAPVKEKFQDGKLVAHVPRKVATKLNANDVIEVLGILSPDMQMLFPVLVLTRERDSVVSNILFSENETWANIYMSLDRRINRASAAG